MKTTLRSENKQSSHKPIQEQTDVVSHFCMLSDAMYSWT